ncbi:hypothetical protein SAMN05878503_101251 [Cereibacter ovatus]|uniref:Cytochrome c domain-containing protein n=1 Tax=Cereibacter ovatus TaxID=439529 RepID=A0A285CJ38_9RHOB|nr:c-type cytochrome [Cereibacter ovatus]SNX67614.1 hypothetical protein SAMN05878503_101251 [Cereibacter ovatus]
MIRTILGGLALALFAAPWATAQTMDAGKTEYMVACASCHGESGKGQGPMAEVLSIETPSLTGLSKAHDGKFPFQEVFMIVDGRTGVRGHGGPMPIWGERYKATAEPITGPYGSELIVRGRILSLVLYLESIQE